MTEREAYLAGREQGRWDQMDEMQRAAKQQMKLPKIDSDGLRLSAKEGHQRVSSVVDVRNSAPNIPGKAVEAVVNALKIHKADSWDAMAQAAPQAALPYLRDAQYQVGLQQAFADGIEAAVKRIKDYTDLTKIQKQNISADLRLLKPPGQP